MASQAPALTPTRTTRTMAHRLGAVLQRLWLPARDPWSAYLGFLLRCVYMSELISRLLAGLHPPDPARSTLWLLGSLLFAVYLLAQGLGLRKGELGLTTGTVTRRLVLDLLFFSLFFVLNGDHESNLVYTFLVPLIFAASYLPLGAAIAALATSALLLIGCLAVIWLGLPTNAGSFLGWLFMLTPPMHNAPMRVWFITSALFSVVALPIARTRLLAEQNRRAKLRHHRLTQLLAERAPALARGDDIENIVGSGLQAAWDEVPCEAVALFIYSPRSGQLERFRTLGVEDSWFPEERYAVGEGITGKVISPDGAGRPMLDNQVRRRRDARHDHLERYVARLPSGRTEQLLAVPLQGANRAFGILRAVNKRLPSGAIDPLGFTDDDRDILAALATLMALAYCAQRRTEKTQAVFDVNATLAQTLDSDQVCAKLAEVIVRDGYAACCVLLRDQTGGLRLHAATGLSPDQATMIERLVALGPPRAAVLADRRPSVILDLHASADSGLALWMQAAGLRSSLRLPLLHHGAVIGLLEIYSATRHEFYPEAVASLTIIATQAAAAIMSARLSEHSQQQIQMLTRLTALVVRLMRHEEEQQLFDDAVHRAAMLFQAEDCSIFWVNRDQQMIDLKASNCTPRSLFGRRPSPISAAPKAGLVAFVAATMRPLYFTGASFRQHPAWDGSFSEHLRYLPSQQCASLLLQPIFSQENELVGVLKLENKQGVTATEGFSYADRELSKLLATQISLAVEKIHRLRKLTLLHDIAGQIIAICEPRDVLRRIATAARAVVAADRVQICPFDPAQNSLAAHQAVCISDADDPGPPQMLSDQQLAELLADKRGVKVFAHPDAAAPQAMAATIAVVLRVREAVVGVLLYDFHTRPHYSQGEISDAETFGKLAAITIQNANLYAEATRVTHELDAMQRLTQTALANGELRLERVVDVVLDTIQDSLGYNFCALNLVNDAEQFIEGQDARGIANAWIADSRHALSSNDIQAHVVRTGATLVQTGWNEHFDKAIYERYDHGSLVRIFTPIRGRDGFIGTVEAGFELRNRAGITQAEQETLCRYVGQVALVIESVRQLDASRRHSSRVSQMQDLVHDMLRLTPHARIEPILERAAGMAGALLDPGARLYVHIKPPAGTSHASCQGCPSHADGHGLAGACTQLLDEGGRAVFAGGVCAPGRQLPFACVPIRLGSETLGALCVRYERDHWFGLYERDFLELCAAHLATALVNARSQQRLAESRDWLEGEINHFYHDLVGSGVARAAHALEIISSSSGPLTAKQRGWAEESISELTLVGDRIGYLLELRRSETSDARLSREAIPVATLVQGAVQRIGRKAASKQIAVSCQIEPNCVALVLHLDHERVGAAIDNLLRNAVKYTPEHGRVDTTVQRRGDSLLIDVEDNGIGIDPAFHGRIFEKYFQLDRSPSLGRSGLGLGLSIALHFITLHGGTIKVQSRPQGGTRFRITLPMLVAHAQADPHPPLAGTVGHSGLLDADGAALRHDALEEAQHVSHHSPDRRRAPGRRAARRLVRGKKLHRARHLFR